MNIRLVPLLSLVLFTCTPHFKAEAAFAPTEAFEEKRIASIEIEIQNLPAEKTFDQSAVLTKMDTKTGDPFSQLAFDRDLKMLASEYDRVEPFIDVKNGEVYLTIKVWPRPKIHKIRWTGNQSVSAKTLSKELGIKPGSTFKRQNFNKAFNKVKEYYIKKGYFESQLEYHLERNIETNEVDIEIDVHEGRPGIIDDIQFEGFSDDEKSRILDMIYTKKYNLLFSWLTGQGRFNEEAIEHDKLTIVDFLQNEGYADAKVTLEIKDAPAAGKIIIVLAADKGALYHFGNITFSGNTLFSNEEIEPLFVARPGKVYSPETLRESSHLIKELYGRKGYIDTVVDYETNLVEDQPIYNVHFSIEEGERFKIGVIRVYGNTQTKTHVILRESLLVPGEVFDAAKLKATQQKLEAIGYFKNVNVYAVRTQDDDSLGESYRDVFIEVEETTTGSISAFAGFSTADNVFGGIELSETNFNYRGLGQLFTKGLPALRGGGEYLQLKANIGASQTSYVLSWLTPYFRDTLWRVGFDISRTTSHVVNEGIQTDTTGGSLFASYPVTNLWTFGWRYRVRNAINKKRGHEAHSEQERDAISQHGVISATSVSMNFDSTDRITKPHNGFRSYIEAEYAGLGGKFYFGKFSYLNSYYTLMWPRGIMKYRFDFRFIQPIFGTSSASDIPISERFYLGGEGSVRGYTPYGLAPYYDGTHDPKGGISSSVLSIEYLHEILRILDGFLFIDAGSLSAKQYRVGTFRMSWGLGIRLELMNRVPITLGMGFPINPADHQEVQKFYFSMGGQF